MSAVASPQSIAFSPQLAVLKAALASTVHGMHHQPPPAAEEKTTATDDGESAARVSTDSSPISGDAMAACLLCNLPIGEWELLYACNNYDPADLSPIIARHLPGKVCEACYRVVLPLQVFFTALIFPTETILTVLIFPNEVVLTVFIFPTEIVLTVLIFPTEIVLTMLIFITEIVLTVLIYLTKSVLTVLIFLLKSFLLC